MPSSLLPGNQVEQRVCHSVRINGRVRGSGARVRFQALFFGRTTLKGHGNRNVDNRSSLSGPSEIPLMRTWLIWRHY